MPQSLIKCCQATCPRSTLPTKKNGVYVKPDVPSTQTETTSKGHRQHEIEKAFRCFFERSRLECMSCGISWQLIPRMRCCNRRRHVTDLLSRSWNCCDRRTCFVTIWKHFCFILSTGTKMRIDSVMHPRSSSRGRNTSGPVTVTHCFTRSWLLDDCINGRQ